MFLHSLSCFHHCAGRGALAPALSGPCGAWLCWQDSHLRKSHQLFVSWASPHRGRPVTKQHLSHWLVEVIALSYSNQGLQPPADLQDHFTRWLATLWAFFRGVDLQEISAAASWSLPLTFAQFYRLDMSALPVAGAVLLPWFGLLPAGLVGGHRITCLGNTGASISHIETLIEYYERELKVI